MRLAFAALVLAGTGVAAIQAPAGAVPDLSAGTPPGGANRQVRLVLRPAPAHAIKPIPGFKMNAVVWFHIQNLADARFCLDADTRTMGAQSTKVQMYACNWGAANQMWAQARDTAGVLHLLNAGRQVPKCLDADTLTLGGNGTKVQLWECTTGARNQGWQFEMDSSAYWHLRVDVSPRRSLDADKKTLGRNESLVHLWDHTPGASNQGWIT